MAEEQRDPKEQALEAAQYAFDKDLPRLTDGALETWVKVYEWRLERLNLEIGRRKGPGGRRRARQSALDAAAPHPKFQVHRPGDD
jgi:hypothetical protein